MQGFSTLFFATVALLAGASGTDEVQVVPISQQGLKYGRSSPSPGRGSELTRPLLFGVVSLAATVAMVYLILQCSRAIRSNGNSSGYLMNKRRLEDPERNKCEDVGICRQERSIHASPCKRNFSRREDWPHSDLVHANGQVVSYKL